MRFYCRLLTFVVAALFFCLPAAGQASGPNEAVHWYRADFPPVSILGGPNAEQGYFDRLLAFLIQRLPAYEHQHYTANFKRIVFEIRKGAWACCPSLIKTAEREQFIVFSVPALVVLPNGVVARQRSRARLAPYLTDQGKISLARLIEDRRLRLGISSGRKYDGGIDEILAEHAGEANIHVRTHPDVFEGLLTLLRAGRLDYIIGYPTEAQYFAQQAGGKNDLIFYPIAENRIDFTLGYVGCPDTAWGRAVIRAVDKILLAHRQTPAFMTFYERWLDEGTIPLYRRMAADFYGHQTP